LKLQLKSIDLIEDACEQWVISMGASWYDIKEAGKTFREYMKRFLEGKQGDDLKQEAKRIKTRHSGGGDTVHGRGK
jgi:hypothetical protein